METYSALLALCAGNSPVTGEFPSQRPVTRSFDVFFDLSLNKRLSKQPWGWWFETASRSLWRHCNEPFSFHDAIMEKCSVGTVARLTGREGKWHTVTIIVEKRYRYIDGLVQDCGISIANALEILQSCTKPSIYCFPWQISVSGALPMQPLQWRHNERDGVSHHQPHDCLLNHFLKAQIKKHQSSASLTFVRGIHWWPVNSPHKGPVTRKRFPFDYVTMTIVTFYVTSFPGCRLPTRHWLDAQWPTRHILRPTWKRKGSEQRMRAGLWTLFSQHWHDSGHDNDPEWHGCFVGFVASPWQTRCLKSQCEWLETCGDFQDGLGEGEFAGHERHGDHNWVSSEGFFWVRKLTLPQIMIWINNCNRAFLWDVITYPCPNFKLGWSYGMEEWSHSTIFLWM